MKIFIIYPVHLFKNINILKNMNKIFIVEEEIYFTKYKFHKLKLAFHRATMKKYYDYLENKIGNVKYYDYDKDYFKDLNNHEIYYYDPVDKDIDKKIKNGSNKYGYKFFKLETLEFVTSFDDLKKYDELHHDKKFKHDASFYKWQRERLNILTPIGKKYKLSYDDENRLKFVDNQKEIFNPKINKSKYVIEAIKYVNTNFKNNWGSLDSFIYPIDHDEAEKWLKNFIKTRFKNFGKYEDAFSDKIKFGYHSVLSPLLNVGLLTDNDILNKILPLESKITISSFEGYIRQLIGWKQAMRYLYQFKFEKFNNVNYFKNNNKISNKFWTGLTGIPPVDNCIKKIYEYGYLHHIERLMIMGQFFLLTMIKPDDVFDWYISLVSMDAYQWVMYPNIYGMITYADGGYMMSRPYFSSSAYIKKMSNYSDNKTTVLLEDNNNYTWDEIWDALYYNFIKIHKNKLKKIYATARNVYHWNNKSKEDKNKLLSIAKMYLHYLFKK